MATVCQKTMVEHLPASGWSITPDTSGPIRLYERASTDPYMLGLVEAEGENPQLPEEN